MLFRARSTSLALLLGFAGVTPAIAQAPAAAIDPTARAAATITAEDVRARIAYLASDALKGRDTPSPGLDSAAAYIAREFKSFGLQPAGDSGTFIQRFPLRSTKLRTAGLVLNVTGPKPRSFAYGTDYFVVPAQRDSASGELAYFGGATTAASRMSGSAQGKVAMVYAPGTSPTQEWNQQLLGGFMAAQMGGAVALLVILDPGFPDEAVRQIADQLGSGAGGMQVPMPIVGVRYKAIADLFTDAGKDLDALRANEPAAAVPLPGALMTIRTPKDMAEARVPNVVAVLPGSDPVLKDTYIIFSAHMDHVGVGAPNANGDSIYNGADDDASGTSAVVELAQAFAAANPRPKRSIVFMTVSGEEKGLLGSSYFSDNPTIPIDRVVANINMDMVGRNDPDTVVAIGQDYSSLGPLLQDVAKAHPELELTAAPDQWPDERLFFRSDHFSFARKGIPVLFFTTGLHADYHKPSDEPQTIDNDKVARIARLAFYLGNAVATRAEKPEWTEKGKADMKAIGVVF